MRFPVTIGVENPPWAEKVGIRKRTTNTGLIGRPLAPPVLYEGAGGKCDVEDRKLTQGPVLSVSRSPLAIEEDGAFDVRENGKSMYVSGEHKITFDFAYLYLQISSHSNYPPREVFFDNIEVRTEE